MTSAKLKKILTLVTIVCLATAGAIGILFLINIEADFLGDATKFLVKVLLTLLVVFLAGLFLLNSVEAIARKNILGFVSAGLIGLSSLMFLVSIWAGLNEGFYIHLTCIIAAITILFNMIVANVIVIGKKLLPLQIITYVTLLYVELAIVLLICGSNALFGDIWLIFAVDAIVCVVLSIVLSIKRKSVVRASVNQTEAAPAVAEEMVTITKSEYQALQNRIAELENQLANK
ncbi:MAG: hypothetical protein IKC47_05115 [Clostridia bacterium]|nr:hypothetical protein [Clostridia bacterium]